MSNRNKHRTQHLPLPLQLSIKRNLMNYTQDGIVKIQDLVNNLIMEFDLVPTDENETNYAQVGSSMRIRDLSNVVEHFVQNAT